MQTAKQGKSPQGSGWWATGPPEKCCEIDRALEDSRQVGPLGQGHGLLFEELWRVCLRFSDSLLITPDVIRPRP
jgi:hypothetical protein